LRRSAFGEARGGARAERDASGAVAFFFGVAFAFFFGAAFALFAGFAAALRFAAAIAICAQCVIRSADSIAESGALQ